ERLSTLLERRSVSDRSTEHSTAIPLLVLRTLAAMPLSDDQRRRLEPTVMSIAGDNGMPPMITVLALRVAGSSAELPDAVIDRLIAILGGRSSTTSAAGDMSLLDRPAAAMSLAAATLSPGALESVAATFGGLSGGEIAILLPPFIAHGGDVLAKAIDAIAAIRHPEMIPRAVLEKAVAALPDSDASIGRALLYRLDAARPDERESFERLARSLPDGDATRGHAIYLSNRAACTTCHAMAYAGGRIGPDLSKIGGIRSARDILEAIVLPSASFVRSYEPVVVLTDDGRVHSGIIREEYDAELVLQTSATAFERIPRTAIESIEAGSVSLMPKGYDSLLSPQELADLVAFLARAR
ncbi:MAG: hypothetical protein ACKOCN_02820, partial [Planctomycetaceae bacterium]